MASRHMRRLKGESLPDQLDSEELETQSSRHIANAFGILSVDDDVPQTSDTEMTIQAKHSKRKKKSRAAKLTKIDLEVETILATLEKPQQSSTEVVPAPIAPTYLRPQPKYLDADYELKRMFGAKVVRKEKLQQSKRDWFRGKKTLLSKSKREWPRLVCDIQMRLVRVHNSFKYFEFEYDAAYLRANSFFAQMVATHDPQNIMAVLTSYPYHIESLMQLAEVMQQTGDFQGATDFFDRALFAFECCFHPSFDFMSGNCRMEFNDSNRAFFLLLFKQIQSFARRGLHRAAFEMCKLLLQLDPIADPVGVLLCMDYHGLKCEEFSSVLELAAHRAVSGVVLPNLMFSRSLAKFSASQAPLDVKLGSSTEMNADEALQQAILTFPMVIGPLVTKCGISLHQGDIDGKWDDLLKHHLFRQGCPAAVQRLLDVFVERHFSLWKNAAVMQWLKRNCVRVASIVDVDPQGMSSYSIVREEVCPPIS